MNYIIGADRFVSEQIRNMRYTDKPKTWKVSDEITIGWDDILPDPPMNDSETTKKELIYLSKLTKSVNSSQLDLIKLVDEEPNDLFHKTMKDLGVEFPKEIFDRSWKLIKPVIMNLKYIHNRPRPYQLSEKYGLKIKLRDSKTAQTPAYPSGHTAYTALSAYILAAKYPQFAEHFFDKIQSAGMARMLMGVHYPSDNEASMIITGALWEDIRYKLFPELPNFRS
jgi:acid phosphatase (class A)